jgi:hypothetical protein
MTVIHAIGKRPNQIYRVYGEWGERRFPELRHRSDLYNMLRLELRLPTASGRGEIVQLLMYRSWDAKTQEWVPDSEALHGPRS